MAQISFTINNGSVPNTIYVPTDDPGVNKISLLISSDTTLSLIAGTPVEESQAAASTSSLFYLHIASLGLTTAELNHLAVTLAGWNTKVFADTQVICLTPQQKTTLTKGQNLVASIGSFTASTAPSGSSAQLYMSFYRAGPISSGTLPYTYNNTVILQAPPTGQLDLHDVLAASLNFNTIIQSLPAYPDVKNTINLIFSPGEHPEALVAGPNTIFTIGFVYAEDQYGYGALTTINDALNIQVDWSDNAADWLITPPPKASQNPAWMLQVPNGQSILGATVDSTVGFSISKIKTAFQAGATLMLVTYSGVPGYQDGAFSIVLNKVAHVDITNFNVSPNAVVLSESPASVTVSWNVNNAASRWLYVGDAKPVDVTDNDNDSAAIQIKETTNFWLEATGYGPGGVDNKAISPNIQVVVQPQLVSFSASPAAIYARDWLTPYPVKISWEVNGAPYVEVALDDGELELDAKGQRIDNLCVSASGEHTYKLTAQCSEAGPKISQKLTVPTYLAIMRVVTTEGITYGITAVPHVPFVALNLGTEISIISTVTGNKVATESVSGYFRKDTPAPIVGSVVFSHDGKIMLISQSTDTSAIVSNPPSDFCFFWTQIEVFSVAASTGSESFEIAHIQSLQFEQGSPVITFNSDGSFFVAVNGVSLVDGLNTELHFYAKGADSNYTDARITLPDQYFWPILSVFVDGLALSPDGKRLFVSRFIGTWIGVLSLTLADQSWAVIDQRELDYSDLARTSDLFLTPDGGTLISFSGNDISLYDLSPTRKPRRDLWANAPTALGIILNGEYAVFASADGANMINIELGTISPPIPIPQGSTAMCIVNDETMAFASSAQSGLTVLSFLPPRVKSHKGT